MISDYEVLSSLDDGSSVLLFGDFPSFILSWVFQLRGTVSEYEGTQIIYMSGVKQSHHLLCIGAFILS